VEIAEKNMKRKITLLTLCAMLFALCSSIEAQQSSNVSRIGKSNNPFSSLPAERLDPSVVKDCIECKPISL
jgi:hypothetical protein